MEGRAGERNIQIQVCSPTLRGTDSRAGRLFSPSLKARAQHTCEHEVGSRAETRRSPSTARGDTGVSPPSSRSPALGPTPFPPPADLHRRKGKDRREGEVVPGDFTLFEASVFRYCRGRPGGFSLLLHWHLPPSPAGWAGEPGKGAEVRWRPFSAGTRFPESSKRSRAAGPHRRGPAAAGSQVWSAWDRVPRLRTLVLDLTRRR